MRKVQEIHLQIKICPVCNTKLEENEKECTVCGYHLEQEKGHPQNSEKGTGKGRRVCAICGAQINPEDTVCPLCGIFVGSLPEEEVTSAESDGKDSEREEAIGQEIQAGAKASAKSKASAEPKASAKSKASAKPKASAEQEIAAANAKRTRVTIILVVVGIAALFLIAGSIYFFMLREPAVSTDNNTSVENASGQEQPKAEEEDDGKDAKPTVEEEDAGKDKTPIAEEEDAGKDTEPIAEEEDAGKKAESIEDKEEQIRIDDYCGYWYISGNPERELKIEKFTDDTVLFSLCYYRLGFQENIKAHLEGDTAYFSTNDGGEIEGSLIFNKDFIIVQITKSENMYMPVETMAYEVRYDYSPMEQYDSETAPGEVRYPISVAFPPAYIYAGPGYEYGIVGMITDNYEYTIIEEAETYAGDDTYLWGKLMSGAGWINVTNALADGPGEAPEYILPNSSTMLLTYEDIQNLSGEQLRLARNEIYARHGRKFDDEGIRAYFESQWWYDGVIEAGDFSEDMLSDIERSNAEFIMTYE